MAIKFQYNKTSLHTLNKQLKVRERALPTIKSKESALRMEVKRTKDEIAMQEDRLEKEIRTYDFMMALWNEFRPELISVKNVGLSSKKIAGVLVPVLDGIEFETAQYSLFNMPSWFTYLKLNMLERARRKTTQKLNLFEKVQIPGYKDAIRKVKRFMEDEESLSKSSQKIMRNNQEKRNAQKEKEVEA